MTKKEWLAYLKAKLAMLEVIRKEQGTTFRIENEIAFTTRQIERAEKDITSENG